MKKDTFDPEEWEEVPDDSQDPFPKLYNMADQSFIKNGKKYRRKAPKDSSEKEKRPELPFNCGHCGAGFSSMVEYSNHRKICIPDEDFGLTSDIMDSYYGEYLNGKGADKMDCDDKKTENVSTSSTEKKEEKKSDTYAEKTVENVSTTSAEKKEENQTTTPTDKKVENNSTPTTEGHNKLDGGAKENVIQNHTFYDTGMTTKLVPNSTTISYVCNSCSACFDWLKQYEEHKSSCIQANAKVSGRKKKDNTHNKKETTRSGETKNGHEKNSDIPQTHSTKTTERNGSCQNSENGNNNLSAQPDDADSNVNEKDESKKKDKIPLTNPSKITKTAKPPKAPKLKKMVEIDVKGDDKKKVVDSGPSPDPISSDPIQGEINKTKNNIQMESLRQNLPSASTTSGLFCIRLAASLLITSLIAVSFSIILNRSLIYEPQ